MRGRGNAETWGHPMELCEHAVGVVFEHEHEYGSQWEAGARRSPAPVAEGDITPGSLPVVSMAASTWLSRWGVDPTARGHLMSRHHGSAFLRAIRRVGHHRPRHRRCTHGAGHNAPVGSLPSGRLVRVPGEQQTDGSNSRHTAREGSSRDCAGRGPTLSMSAKVQKPSGSRRRRSREPGLRPVGAAFIARRCFRRTRSV